MKKIALIALLILNSGIASAGVGSASWAIWNGTVGTFTQNGNIITVTYTGESDSRATGAYIFNDVPGSFTNADVTNTPGSNGTIAMTGGKPGINNLHFSQAVIDPLIALWSVGQSNVPVTFNFTDNPTFSILSQGAGHWSGGTLVQAGSSVTGNEGNGLIQFKGSFTDINFTTPNYEDYYGFTTGALITAVPEPEVYALLIAGLGLVSFMARRRKENQA
jgi:hypothetical protein